MYVWGRGTGLRDLDCPRHAVGVPSKSFDFIRLINGLCACVCGGVRRIESVDNPYQYCIITLFPGNTQGKGGKRDPIEGVAPKPRAELDQWRGLGKGQRSRIKQKPMLIESEDTPDGMRSPTAPVQ